MRQFQYKQQKFQKDAVAAVVDIFHGVGISKYQQPNNKLRLTNNSMATPERTETPPTKYFRQLADTLKNNLHAIQKRNNIRANKLNIAEEDYLVLDTQMETGTGKTFTFINTIFELHKQHSLMYFVIIVPSIAIKEGIKKSFDTTQSYFERLYHQRIKVYEMAPAKSKKGRKSPPSGVMSFVHSQCLTVLIMTNHAFNSAKNVINQELEGFYADNAKTPMAAIAAKHPVLIIDEPQRVEGAQTTARIKDFTPLFALRYSATFREGQIKNLVYVLDSYDAFSKKLVKNITVTDYKTGQTDSAFIGVRRLLKDSVVELEAADKNGKPVYVRTGVEKENSKGELHAKTKNQTYQDLRVTRINQREKIVGFSDGKEIKLGEYTGREAQNEHIVSEVMLRDTIDKHLSKECKLFARDIKIKCLSLIFIDRVKDYRNYDTNDSAGYLQRLFERCYEECTERLIKAGVPDNYRDYLNQWQPAQVHGGYFSGDRKRNSKIDEGNAERGDETARQLQQEISELILRDKEKILDPNNNLRFIFAHSALREGWDNPNVFQICKLRTAYSETGIVQEVGRGLRICVNSELARQDEEEVGDEFSALNRLDVFTLGNGEFISKLQRELSARRNPAKISFIEITSDILCKQYGINVLRASKLWLQLHEAGCIDEDGRLLTIQNMEGILSSNGLEANKLLGDLPAELPQQPDVTDGRSGERKARTYRVSQTHYNQFKALWQLLHQKVIYEVKYSKDFENQAVEKINAIDCIAPLYVSRETIEVDTQDGEFTHTEAQESVSRASPSSDMPAKAFLNQLAEKTKLPRNTIIRILSKVKEEQYKAIKTNPYLAVQEVAKAINSVIYQNIVDNIRYHKINGWREPETRVTLSDKQFTATQYIELDKLKKYQGNNLWEEIAPYDSKDPEKEISINALASSQITVFAKIPRAVNIPTPLHPKGINPDFALVVRKQNSDNQFYFVAEAKPTTDTDEWRNEERRRVEFMKKYFEGINADIQFNVISNYRQLLGLLNEVGGQ